VSTSEERRRWARIRAEHLVSYARLDENGEPHDRGMARTLDLSEGGMVLEMTRPADVGEDLQIRMVTGDQILTATATVVYSNPLQTDRWRVGVQFTKVPDKDLATIAQEVARFQQGGGRG
jgi:c-di-GMP-binding flagellar brake protein YcgR